MIQYRKSAQMADLICFKNMLKKLFKIISTSLFLGILLFISAKNVMGAVRCETQYGGGQVCVRTGQLQIDKEIFNPDKKEFVDNLDFTSFKFNAGNEVKFKLKIKNVGDATFDKVSVNDTLPSFLELVSGSLSFEINDLTPGETEEREIVTKVVSSSKLPAEPIICDVNTAEVKSGDERDKDTAKVCVEKKVLGAIILPPTGPENWLLILIVSIVAGIAGFTLKRINKLYLG